jgi:hypothetical protein
MTSTVFVLGLLAGKSRADDGPKVAATFHVGPNGLDTWSGTLAAPNGAKTDGPFATLARARDAVRRFRSTARPRGAVMVALHAGRYELSEPLVFIPEDSGTPQSPTVFAAFSGDEGEGSDQRGASGQRVEAGARSAWRVGRRPSRAEGWLAVPLCLGQRSVAEPPPAPRRRDHNVHHGRSRWR